MRDTLKTTEKIVKGSVQQTSTGKLILHITLESDSIEALCLQTGLQPEGLFNTLLIYRKGSR